MRRARTSVNQPPWLDDAHDEFVELCRHERIPRDDYDRFVDRWLERCTTRGEVRAFERAVECWMRLRAGARVLAEREAASRPREDPSGVRPSGRASGVRRNAGD
ncbi:MAG: hypothetical protein AMXMBFR77_01770 [Phycisphaerales bacterium]|nr:hypothetical protein [Phycisphaerales bacterium]MDL1903871.1 hypothetical protein [Synechococcales cyanobacterium CNB]GIK18586.1 MAG: hypothetical protein BroJett004_07500 [Planctomycetota bacterium]